MRRRRRQQLGAGPCGALPRPPAGAQGVQANPLGPRALAGICPGPRTHLPAAAAAAAGAAGPRTGAAASPEGPQVEPPTPALSCVGTRRWSRPSSALTRMWILKTTTTEDMKTRAGYTNAAPARVTQASCRPTCYSVGQQGERPAAGCLPACPALPLPASCLPACRPAWWPSATAALQGDSVHIVATAPADPPADPAAPPPAPTPSSAPAPDTHHLTRFWQAAVALGTSLQAQQTAPPRQPSSAWLVVDSVPPPAPLETDRERPLNPAAAVGAAAVGAAGSSSGMHLTQPAPASQPTAAAAALVPAAVAALQAAGDNAWQGHLEEATGAEAGQEAQAHPRTPPSQASTVTGAGAEAPPSLTPSPGSGHPGGLGVAPYLGLEGPAAPGAAGRAAAEGDAAAVMARGGAVRGHVAQPVVPPSLPVPNPTHASSPSTPLAPSPLPLNLTLDSTPDPAPGPACNPSPGPGSETTPLPSQAVRIIAVRASPGLTASIQHWRRTGCAAPASGASPFGLVSFESFKLGVKVRRVGLGARSQGLEAEPCCVPHPPPPCLSAPCSSSLPSSPPPAPPRAKG
ncbi:hypothetical protein V8C86DRAFT_2525288 [Haematococcus lacustris]